MQRAVIFGDLTADATSDQYPTVTLCDSCIEADAASKEDSQVVSIDREATPEDGPCEWCDAESDE